MGGQDKQCKDECKDDPVAISRLKKELERKQEALVKSERGKTLLKKKVDELSKKHACLTEEFHATFNGLNSEKERLASKIEEQSKLIDGLTRSEPLKLKKIQKYVKYFMEIDEDKELDIKEMVEKSESFRRNLMGKARRVSDEPQVKENGGSGQKEKNGDTTRILRAFQLMLERYIEQNEAKDNLMKVYKEEAAERPYKDLEIWNLKQEIREKEADLAKTKADTCCMKACFDVEIQRRVKLNEEMERLRRYQRGHIRQIRNELKMIQAEDPIFRRNQENRALAEEKLRREQIVIMRNIKSCTEFDNEVLEFVGQTRELIYMYEEIRGANEKLINRVRRLENVCILVSDEDSKNPTLGKEAKAKSRSFFDRFRRKKNKA